MVLILLCLIQAPSSIDGEIETLIVQLGAEKYQDREAAMERIDSLGRRATKALVAAVTNLALLSDSNPIVPLDPEINPALFVADCFQLKAGELLPQHAQELSYGPAALIPIADLVSVAA